MERFIGKVIKIQGNQITFQLDREIDYNSLSRLSDGRLPKADVVFSDQRDIKPDQRKKAWALIREISLFTGYGMVDTQQLMKGFFMADTGHDIFSLSDCSVSTAREFISWMIEFCFKFNIPFKDKLSTLTDDTNRSLYLCIVYRKCCLCGLHADIHHVDNRVGMGRNRDSYDHGQSTYMALCRRHHNEAHNIGQYTFNKKHHVEGIKIKDEDLVKMKIMAVRTIENRSGRNG